MLTIPARKRGSCSGFGGGAPGGGLGFYSGIWAPSPLLTHVHMPRRLDTRWRAPTQHPEKEVRAVSKRLRLGTPFAEPLHLFTLWRHWKTPRGRLHRADQGKGRCQMSPTRGPLQPLPPCPAPPRPEAPQALPRHSYINMETTPTKNPGSFKKMVSGLW